MAFTVVFCDCCLVCAVTVRAGGRDLCARCARVGDYRDRARRVTDADREAAAVAVVARRRRVDIATRDRPAPPTHDDVRPRVAWLGPPTQSTAPLTVAPLREVVIDGQVYDVVWDGAVRYV